MRHKRWNLVGWLAFVIAGATALPLQAQEASLDQARALWLTGKYAEAADLYHQLARRDADPVSVAVGLSRCYQSQGQRKEAASVVEEALRSHRSADLLARAAELHLLTGQWDQAARLVKEAVAAAPDHLLARWVDAQLALHTDRLEEANSRLEWFIHRYAEANVERPDDLLLMGQAASLYIRWNMRGQEQKEQLEMVLNDLYYEASRQDENFWQGSHAAALLWLETYNKAEALRDLQQALAINPQAAEVHVALGRAALQDYQLDNALQHCQRALEINPGLVEAYQLRADLHLVEHQFAEATERLEHVIELNPHDPGTLGRLAACDLLRDHPEVLAGLETALAELLPDLSAASEHIGARAHPPGRERPGGDKGQRDTRLVELLRKARGSNYQLGLCLHTLAERLADQNQLDAAAAAYRFALAAMPQLAAARNGLGLVFMRMGDEDAARETLGAAFEADPFNVRVHNMLKVLDVLKQYETLETPHFRISFDPQQDRLLARYMGQYLEEVYQELTRELGYALEKPTRFEIFNDAQPYEGHRKQNGHEWFSARTVGLPEIHTIGACVGKVVALTSPEEIREPFDWARVVKHEYVHVLNLQQTRFRIPHWFTEGLAVFYEGEPYPAEWNELLQRRVTANELLTLENINRAFIQPKKPEDRTLAYYQAFLYVRYIRDEYGKAAIPAVLKAYHDGLTTRQAVPKVFGVPVPEFEEGYRRYLETVIAERRSPGSEPTRSFSQLERDYRADSDNPDLAAQLAEAYFRRRAYPEARQLAQKALRLQPHHPKASYVMARLHLVIGDREAALAQLKAALDFERPDPQVLALLAHLHVKEKRWEEAERLYKRAHERDPHNSQWVRGLVQVYLIQQEREPLRRALRTLVGLEPHQLTAHKKLAQLALAAEDFADSEHHANQALHMNVRDAGVHRMLGDAFAGQNRWPEAIAEYKTVLELDPEDRLAQERLQRAQTAAQDSSPQKLPGDQPNDGPDH